MNIFLIYVDKTYIMQWWFFSIYNYVIYYKSVNYIILNNKTGGRTGLTVLPFLWFLHFKKIIHVCCLQVLGLMALQINFSVKKEMEERLGPFRHCCMTEMLSAIKML